MAVFAQNGAAANADPTIYPTELKADTAGKIKTWLVKSADVNEVFTNTQFSSDDQVEGRVDSDPERKSEMFDTENNSQALEAGDSHNAVLIFSLLSKIEPKTFLSC